jgi:hypothetical protein
MPDEDQKHHIYDERFKNINLRMDSQNTDFSEFKTEMKNGIAGIYSLLEKRSSESKHFGKEFISLLVIGVTALWFVISLLVNPIASNQAKISVSLTNLKTDVEASLPLMDYKTKENAENLDKNLSKFWMKWAEMNDEIDAIRAQEVGLARWQGGVDKALEWLRDDATGVRENLRGHEAMQVHPTSNEKMIIGRLEALAESVTHLETYGSSAILREIGNLKVKVANAHNDDPDQIPPK